MRIQKLDIIQSLLKSHKSFWIYKPYISYDNQILRSLIWNCTVGCICYLYIPPNCWEHYSTPLVRILHWDRNRWDVSSWDWWAAGCGPCERCSAVCWNWCGSMPCADAQPPWKEETARCKLISNFRCMHSGTECHSLKDAPVHNQHDNAWYPEAHWTGDECVGLVNHKWTLIRMQGNLAQMLGRCVPAQENRCKRNKGG